VGVEVGFGVTEGVVVRVTVGVEVGVVDGVEVWVRVKVEVGGRVEVMRLTTGVTDRVGLGVRGSVVEQLVSQLMTTARITKCNLVFRMTVILFRWYSIPVTSKALHRELAGNISIILLPGRSVCG
jgi:hypothetical protein